MEVWEATKVRLDLWDETDTGTVPRNLLSALFDNEKAAEAAVLDWSQGMTKNEPTFNLPNIRGWKVREGKILWGFAIRRREVASSHAAKTGRRARHTGESSPQIRETTNASVEGESVVAAGGEAIVDSASEPASD